MNNWNERLEKALEKDHNKGLEFGDHYVGFFYEYYHYLEGKNGT